VPNAHTANPSSDPNAASGHIGLSQLEERCKSLMAQGLAPSTRKVYTIILNNTFILLYYYYTNIINTLLWLPLRGR